MTRMNRGSAVKRGKITKAIIDYQNENNGASPSLYKLSKLSGFSVQLVAYHMRMMEEAGLIKTDNAYPNNITVSTLTKPTKPMEEREMNNYGDKSPARACNTVKPFIERAKEVAAAIDGLSARYGVPAHMKHVSEIVFGPGKRGSLSGVIDKMARQGWVTHERRHQGDLTVTDKGKAVLFGEPTEQMAPWEVEEGMPWDDSVPSVTEPARTPPKPTIPRDVPMDASGWGNATMPEVAASSFTGTLSLEGVDTVDLILEATKRGFKVTR